MDEPTDIGHLLEVPRDQRRDVDPTPQYNADAGFDIEVVPDGEYVELSTASKDEELDEAYDDAGDGSPQAFIAPEDPEFDDLSEDDT
jgi:hypothetical protein